MPVLSFTSISFAPPEAVVQIVCFLAVGTTAWLLTWCLGDRKSFLKSLIMFVVVSVLVYCASMAAAHYIFGNSGRIPTETAEPAASAGNAPGGFSVRNLLNPIQPEGLRVSCSSGLW